VSGSTLRASGFLCALVALGGLLLRWDALSSAPGGVVSRWTGAVTAGLVVASLAGLAAVGLHVAAYFARRREIHGRHGRRPS
jgi:hypothetical protein